MAEGFAHGVLHLVSSVAVELYEGRADVRFCKNHMTVALALPNGCLRHLNKYTWVDRLPGLLMYVGVELLHDFNGFLDAVDVALPKYVVTDEAVLLCHFQSDWVPHSRATCIDASIYFFKLSVREGRSFALPSFLTRVPNDGWNARLTPLVQFHRYLQG